MRERVPLLVGLTLLSIAVLLGAIAVGHGIRDRGKGDAITVTGSAKQRITSDYVIWDLSVSSQQSQASGAGAQLAKWTKSVRAFLVGQGVRGDELTVEPATTESVEDDQGTFLGYAVTRNFEVRSARVQAIAGVAEASARLVANDIPLQPEPVQYVYTHLADIRPKLLERAVRDAQNRGRVLLGATGGKLGKVRGVDVGVFQVTSPNSTEVSDYGVYDTSTLQKDVTAVVNVTFALG